MVTSSCVLILPFPVLSKQKRDVSLIIDDFLVYKLDMSSHMSFCTKSFIADLTQMIFFAFVNCFNVLLQIPLVARSVAAVLTMEIFFILMNSFDVPLQMVLKPS